MPQTFQSKPNAAIVLATTLLHTGAMLCRYGGVQLGPARFMYIVDAARNLLDKGGHVKKPEALPPPPSEEEESAEGSSEDEVRGRGAFGSRLFCQATVPYKIEGK